jgi:hypothetical protein
LEDLGLTVQDGQLNIKYNRFRLNRDKVELCNIGSVLEVFQLCAGATGTVAGFPDQQSIMQSLSGFSSANLSGTGMWMSINVSGNSNLSLSGNTGRTGILSGSGLACLRIECEGGQSYSCRKCKSLCITN